MRARSLMLLATVLPLALAPLGAAAEAEDVPEACDGQMPAFDPETHQLAEYTYYFHSDSQLGDLDGYQGLVTGHPNGQYMDESPPTGDVPKVDTNASRTMYPAGLPGNPIFTAFWGWVDWDMTIACVGWHFWTVGPGQSWDVQLWYDTDFILGDQRFVSKTVTAADGLDEVTASLSLVEQPILARDILWAQFEAHTAPAGVVYGAADFPSSITVVSIEPLPEQ